SVYVFINIRMVSGLLPVVCVPLPFISYCGKSLVTLLEGFGILMSVHTHRTWIAKASVKVLKSSVKGRLAALCGAGSLRYPLAGMPLASATDYEGEKIAEFVREMTQDYGFASEQLEELLAQAERKQGILDAISRPAERVKPWKEYRPIFLTDARVAQGVDFWRE